MSNRAKVLAFAGSLRKDSFNKKLVRIAMNGAAQLGATTTFVDLRDFPLPIFDEDLEKSDGPPANATRLKELFMQHGGLLIASPEYNSSVSAVLKNAIDWVSRPAPGELALQCFDGKVAGLLAASPGALGGLRGLVTLRSILGNIKVIVLPEQLAVPKAHEAFNDDGTLKDQKTREAAERIGAGVATMAERLTRA